MYNHEIQRALLEANITPDNTLETSKSRNIGFWNHHRLDEIIRQWYQSWDGKEPICNIFMKAKVDESDQVYRPSLVRTVQIAEMEYHASIQ